MNLFIGIGVTWVVGMAGYIVLKGKSDVRHRCNVRKHVIKNKLLNNQVSEATKNRR